MEGAWPATKGYADDMHFEGDAAPCAPEDDLVTGAQRVVEEIAGGAQNITFA